MSDLQNILTAYAVQFVMAAILLMLVPFARFTTRRMEITAALSPARQAELYPLVHGVLFEITSLVLMLAFFFADELRRLGWPFLPYLSVTAPFFFLFVLIYRVIRSCQLMRKLPVSEQPSRDFVRFTARASGLGIILLLLVIYVLLFFNFVA